MTGWFLWQKASDVALWYVFYCRSEQIVEQTVELSVIWDTMTHGVIVMTTSYMEHICQWKMNEKKIHKFNSDSTRPLHWSHNDHDGVSNHQPHGCLLNCLFRHRSKKTSKLRVTGLCVGTGEFPAQRASYAENASIWWRHHAIVDPPAIIVWHP